MCQNTLQLAVRTAARLERIEGSGPLALGPPVYLLAADTQVRYLPLRSRMYSYAKHLSRPAMQKRLKGPNYDGRLFALDNYHKSQMLSHSAATELPRLLEVDTSVALTAHKLEQPAEEEQQQPESQLQLGPSIAWIDGPGIPGSFLVAC